MLKNSDGKTVSNRIAFHYVIHGLSATIQNLRLDKDYYRKGETATATFNWTPSADMFFGSRTHGSQAKNIFLAISISNSQDRLCGSGKKETETDPKNIDNITIPVPISDDCINPRANVKILDENEKILDEITFEITSKDTPAAVQTKKISDNTKKYGILAIVILSLISLALIIIKKRTGGIKFIIFLLVFLAGLLAIPEESKAATVTVVSSGSHVTQNAIYDINLNKGTYAPGETMVASARILQHAGCLNGALYFSHAGARNMATGERRPLYNYFTWFDWSGNYYNMLACSVQDFYYVNGWSCGKFWLYAQSVSNVSTYAEDILRLLPGKDGMATALNSDWVRLAPRMFRRLIIPGGALIFWAL